jgi:hypothetical protein
MPGHGMAHPGYAQGKVSLCRTAKALRRYAGQKDECDQAKRMTAMIDLIRPIIGVALVFWGIWNVSVQLERLNPEVFEKAKSSILMRNGASKGVLRMAGLVLYSPYVFPVKATLLWLSLLVILLAL